MEYLDLFKLIKKGKLGSLYLFYGPEEYTKEEALNQTIEVLVTNLRDMNYQMIDGTETSADDIIAASETLPFLSERRLVVVKNYPGLSGKKAGDEDILKDYLGRVPESTCLVFYQRGDVDKKRAIYKAIEKHGEAIEFVRLSYSDLIKWTRKRFQSFNKKISDDDLQYFLMQVGNSLEDIKNEVEKIVAYAGSTPDITRESIDKLVTPSPELTIFQFIDSVSARNKDDALRQMESLIEQGQSIFGILALIARQLKIMLLCKGYNDIGYSLQQIKDKLKGQPYMVHPYAVQKGMQQSRNFTIEQLRQYLNQCLELDYGIKSGKIKERLGIELLVIKMCL